MTRLELAASGVTGRRSNQLSYTRLRDEGGLYQRSFALASGFLPVTPEQYKKLMYLAQCVQCGLQNQTRRHFIDQFRLPGPGQVGLLDHVAFCLRAGQALIP